jgi:hypothetical protein
MKYGYIIGPFRAPTPWEVELNVRAAEQLALEVHKLEAFAVCPHANTRFFDKLLTDEHWIEGTKGLLLRCDFAITVEAIGLPWKHSVGSVSEVESARLAPIPIFHDLNNLRGWLERMKR